jgi:hypothetical protein
MFEIQRPIPAAKPRLKSGVTPLGAMLAAVALLLGLAGPAAAESQTVTGSGTVTKMSVNNATDSVVAKVFGPNFACDGASPKWVQIVMRDSDGTKYISKGRCQPGDPTNPLTGWHVTLERGALKACKGDTVKYSGTGGFWRFEVPRSCLTGLANKIKVTSELASGSPTPGAAGPTRWLTRG